MSSATNWNISTDIYDIVGQIDNLKKRFIEDEDETTLALGSFGFIGDTEAKKIQTAVVMSGELGNEMFPTRAKLDKNITTHAIYCNIGDINAIPSHMMLNLAIKESDLDNYMKSNKFIFDRNCPIYVGDYEFHLDYDLILTRYKAGTKSNWIYNAMYDMSSENYLSDISNVYIRQPYQMNFNNYTYIFMQVLVRQVTIETTTDKMISSSVIDNKSFTFTFDNQLADFNVYVTENGNAIRLKPYLYGSSIDPEVSDYCWYLFMNDQSVRISFDANSYLPGLSAEVKIVAQTTLGAAGNIDYKTEETGYYVDFESSYYNYKRITCYANCATAATEGADRKDMEEIKALIPKMSMSRGQLTSETDLNNYFSLISDNYSRLITQKKVDNQLNRIWYAFLLLKDEENNIIPSNTIKIRLDMKGKYVKSSNEENNYFIPAGTLLKYDSSLDYAVPVDSTPEIYSEDYFNNNGIYYYRLIYNIYLNTNPIYASYYFTLINQDGYFEYEYINPDMFMGFIATTYHLERKLLSEKNIYKVQFTIEQSIATDFGLYSVNDYDNSTTNNMKVFMLLYKGNEIYRYTEATLISYDSDNFKSTWEIGLETNNDFDTEGNLTLLDLLVPGSSESKLQGNFEDNFRASICIYGKFANEEFGRYVMDKTIPGLDGYSIINIYNFSNGITILNDFTNVMNTKVLTIASEDNSIVNYDIYGVPVIGEHYFRSEDNVTYLVNELNRKKAHIDYCLTVLDNNMDIDFKFVNSYGDSKTYHIADKDKTSLGNIDITMKFRLSLLNQYDTVIKDTIVQYIKNYIEDMNDFGNLHIPNMIHDIYDQYKDSIEYIEFMNFNNNRLGINHIELKDVIDPRTVPEFISIRNKLKEDGSGLEPDIDMEIVI